jgi:HSP20 family molecular chaperone IbpA
MARNREESRSGGTAVAERSNQENAVAPREGNGSHRREPQRSLARWPSLLAGASPWELMRRMSEEMNQLGPRIEVEQRGGDLVVRVDLPGLKAEDINVTVDRGMLIISGERRQENREEREGFIRSEVSYGTFYRTIPLPEGADENRVAATFRNGVLEITIPVSEREQGRKVQVQS